jgi:hypothetical protein
MEYSEEVQHLLKQVVDHFDAEDRSVRERQIRVWRRLKLFWEGFHRIYYSEVAHDWRIWDQEYTEQDTDQTYYDKPINVFRAYLESIIAALSVTVPPIKCYPDDADNPLDLTTAKAGDKIAALVYRHNNVQLLWLHALFIYMTEGLVACYSYPKEDKKYGIYKEEKYEEVEEIHQVTKCPLCGYEIEDKVLDTLSALEKDEFMPEEHDVPLHDLMMNRGMEVCPSCAQMMDPDIRQSPLIVTRLVGVTEHPKTRQCLEVYGGLYVKVPVYAMKQCDCPYLGFSYESHYATVLERYPHLREKLRGGNSKIGGPTGVYSPYEQWGRLSPQYQGEYPINTVTVRNFWLRPASFNVLDEEDCDKLKKLFPDGAKVIFINEEFAEAENESLDDCWTLTYNPLADYLHHDPLGLLLTSVQEITNDIVSLTLQTIEHGIPQTFADPSVLDFAAYRQMEVLPGGVYPATPRTGKSLQEGFHEVKTATLSGEILPFAEEIQRLAQLVSGALPSLFGGQMTESRTASEYSMSRSQALQRLQNVWKIFTVWWKEIFGKVIPSYIICVKEDERDVKRDAFGNFINVFVRKAELEGKIGKVELEANENLPITWNQKKEVVMQLLQSANPEILAIIGAPENLPIIREAIGLNEFYVPGEDDRIKQYEEISQLINSEPIVIPPQIDPMMASMNPAIAQDPNAMAMMQPQELPSVEIDPDIDNHQIEFEICRSWLVSDAGRLAKVDNPPGYKNVLLHAKAHLQVLQMQQQMMQMQQQQGEGVSPNEKSKENTETPIQGDEHGVESAV